MAVDLHAHWIPPILASALRKRCAAPRIERGNGGDRLMTFLGSRPFEPMLADLDVRRRFMRHHGTATQMLSLAGLFGVDCLPTEESLPLVTAFNDAAADACRADPRTFVALAALPLADVPLAARELERAHAMGLRGAILPADGFAARATADRYRPLFEAGNRLGSHFFIHPGPIGPRPEIHLRKTGTDNAWQRFIVLETQARLSQVITTLFLSDYLDPYPSVSVQVANLGGAIPFLAERMDEVFRSDGSCGPLPSAQLRRCYVDTASFGPRAIELAVACFGANRVVLGTDCPMFDMERMMKSVADARLDAKTRERLLSGNARGLLRSEPDLGLSGLTRSSRNTCASGASRSASRPRS